MLSFTVENYKNLPCFVEYGYSTHCKRLQEDDVFVRHVSLFPDETSNVSGVSMETRTAIGLELSYIDRFSR